MHGIISRRYPQSLNEMNLIDLLLIVIVLLAILNGWRRGFFLGVLDLAGWIGSLIFGLLLYSPVSHILTAVTGLRQVWAAPIAFLAVAGIAGALIQLVGFTVLRRFPGSFHTNVINRLFGTIPGAINGLVVASIVASVMMALPLGGGFAEAVRDSGITNLLAGSTDWVESALRPIFGQAINRTLNLLTIKPEPESGETIELNYTVQDPRPRPDLEAQMLELVNRERAKAGVGPLVADPELTAVARQHSADMFKRGYFSHETPEKLSPFDRMHNAGVTFQSAGENIALAPTLQIAHTGLMNSPGHRANILQPRFHRVGIGIMDGGWHGIMVTQDFRN
ncbi:MAG TPA: CvpA family protein [Blastocatellia bacterium]